ncbi:MAG: murein biosynthesis integral membrane protein MurJ [Alphaproteobacteria bacterium]|nr:murein biosynthesis integral membrane protein MurJ [Alphaproteobacteria bacterium]
MSLLRSTLTVGGMTMASRVLGFVRDVIMAGLLGAGPVADAFVVAFRLPNLFRRFVGEGAFNSAFVPIFAKRLEAEGLASARRLAEEVLSVLLVALLAFTLLAQMAMPVLAYGLAFDYADDPERWPLLVEFSRIAFPYLLFMSLVALYSGMLNSIGRFAAASAVPIFLNLTLIAALFVLTPLLPTAGHALAWGVAAAGAVQFLFLVLAAGRSGLILRLRRPRLTEGVRRVLILGLPGVLAGGATQINLLVGTQIASMEKDANSILYYADRIFELPLAIIGTAMGVVLLPDLARRLRGGDEAGAHRQMNRAIELSALFTIPSAVALVMIPTEIISVLFERGAFGPDDTARVGAALVAFACGLPAFVMIKVFAPGFFAREDTARPMRYAAVGVAVNIVASLCLFFAFGFVGIAIGTSLGAWANAGLLAWRLHAQGDFRPDPRLLTRLVKILVAAAGMGGALWVLAFALEGLFAQGGILGMVALALLVAGGGLAYLAAAIGLGALDPRELRAMIARAPRPAPESAP